MPIVHYDKCPACGSARINPLLTAKDHTVSGEDFVIWQCADCTLRFTQDVPDAVQIGLYYQSEDYISHTDTAKGLVNATYQKVRRITLAQKAAMIVSATGKEKGKLLDVGCGTGAFLAAMKEKGWEVTGIEPDPGAREVARKTHQLEPLVAGEFYNLPAESFDAITLWHVLEHVHELHRYMEQLKTLLKNDGRLFIAVPNYTSTDANIYGGFWAAYDVPRHLYHFSPVALEKLAGMHGLKLQDKKPMWFDSFYISLLSSKYMKGKTSFFGSLISGSRSNAVALVNKDRCSSLTYVFEKS